MTTAATPAPKQPTFIHPGDGGVLSIASVDEPDEAHTVEAQYNPKELQIDRSVPCTEHSRAVCPNES